MSEHLTVIELVNVYFSYSVRHRNDRATDGSRTAGTSPVAASTRPDPSRFGVYGP